MLSYTWRTWREQLSRSLRKGTAARRRRPGARPRLEQLEDRTVPALADLSVLNTGPAFRPAGSGIDYTVTLTNNGPDAADNVALTATSSAVASVIVPGSATITPASGNPDAFTLMTNGNSFVETATGPIAAGNVDVFFVHLTTDGSAPNGSAVTNAASVTGTTPDPDLGNNAATASTTVVTPTDLAVTKTGPATVTAGATASYTLTVANKGPVDAFSVTLTDALLPGLTLLSETQLSGPDSFTDVSHGNTAEFTAGTVGNGNTDVFQVVARVGSDVADGTTVGNLANVSSANPDPDLSNDTSSVRSAVSASADLSVAKAGPDTVTAGTTATYTITLTNNGPSDAQTVSLSDTLPDGLTRVSQMQTGGTDAFTDTTTDNTPSFSAATVAAGSSDTFVVVATAASSLADGSSVDNTASTVSNTFDPDLTNNSATATSAVTAMADLSVTKSGPATITAGTTATYTITLTNNGPSDAQVVQLSDALPTGLTRVSQMQTGGTDAFSDTSSGNTASFSADTVAAGSSDTFVVVATAASSLADGSSVDDTATASTITLDNNQGNNTSSVSSSVAAVADLSVTKTGPATITAGGTATYTITLTNNGPSDAQGVQLSDALPAGLTLFFHTQTGGADAFTDNSTDNTASFSAPTVVAGNADTFQVIAVAASTLADGTPVDNTATVSATTFDSDQGNNSSTASGSVAATADLAVLKAGPASIAPDTSVTYTLTLTNNGPSAAQAVNLSDALPAGLTRLSQMQTGGTDAFSDTSSGNTPSFHADTMAANSTDTFVVVASAAADLVGGSMLTDTATASATTFDNDTSNNTATLTSTVTGVADLSVTKTGPATVTAGTTATYTITLTNNGPSAAQGVSLSDALPAGLTRLSQMQTGGTDAFSDTSSGNTASFTADTVPAGSSDTFVVVATAASGLTNGSTVTDTTTASTTTSDNDQTNNTSSVSSSVAAVADLSVSKSGPASIAAGGTATYTITLANAGPSDAQTVDLSDVLPSGLTRLSQRQTGGTDAFTDTSTDNTPSFRAATVAAGSSDTFVVVATVAGTLADGSTVTDTVFATSTTPDNNPGNNTASASSTVTTGADLSVTKTGPASATEGDLITYTLSVANAGAADAQGVVLTDTLPAGVTLVSASVGGTTGVLSGNTLTFSLGTVRAGGSVSGTVVVQAVEDGTLTDTASATSTTPDTNPANNTASASTRVAEGGITLTALPVSTTEFAPLNNVAVATFTHANGVQPASAFSATINWGDGTTTAGTVTQSGTTYTVVGSHTYNVDNASPIGVTVTEDGVSATAGAAVAIAEAPAPAGGLGLPQEASIFETMDDAFNQPLSLAQLQGLEFTLLFVELSAANLFSKMGVDPLTAFGLAQSVGLQELGFLASLQAATGSSLDAAVTNLEVFFLVQSQILSNS
jgi:uncharacterized repeat protein (TIGR01451 family)